MDYRRYLLAVLLVIYAFTGVDRLALGLLLQDIKMDLRLSDTELGLLTGIAFALFYSVMGIPLARWADRGNRVSIIAVTCLLWSAAVALCGAAGNFVQLLLMRIAVAVGEAGCLPPAQSLIADYFTRAERPRAAAIYLLGGPLSTLIGSMLAGRLNEAYGWRWTFGILGAPGVVLAVLAWVSLKEPRRSEPARRVGMLAAEHADSSGRVAAPVLKSPSVKEVCVTLWENLTFRQLVFGWAVLMFCGAGIWQWVPTFFIRSFGLGTAELGSWYALTFGVGGAVATACGGVIAARYATQRECLQLKVIAVLYCLFGATTVALFLSRGPRLALVMMSFGAVGVSAIGGPVFAIIQTLAPERMRAQAVAILYLFSNLIGTGLGPLAAGALSDALRPALGGESLRYALVALCPAYLWGAWHFWRASKTVIRDLGVAEDGALTFPASVG